MTWIYRKTEEVHIQGVCVVCGVNKQHSKAKGRYRALCYGCHSRRHGMSTNNSDTRKYRTRKKGLCEVCGFVPIHPCQLDVDHIDGDHENNDPENLQTLCSNCHRLKTYLNKDNI